MNWLRRLLYRWRDWQDARHSVGWYAPAGTYDGIRGGRPSRWRDRYWTDERGIVHDRWRHTVRRSEATEPETVE